MNLLHRFSRMGYLLAFLATIIWSGNFVVARGLNETYTPITMAFFRWGIATLVIVPLAYKQIKRDFHLLRKEWLLVLSLSFIGVTLFNTLIYKAAHTTSAFNLSLIAITAPLYVVLLNRFVFKEFLTKRQVAGLVTLFIGLVLLISKGNIDLLLSLRFSRGDLFMALAASLFGIYSAFAARKKSGNLAFVGATIILGELMLLPLFIGEQLLIGPPLVFTMESIWQLIYIGIGPSIISFYLWNRSIVLVGSTKAATIYNTLPVYSALFAYLLLGESILPIQIISAVIIVGGVLLVIQSRSEPK